MECIFCKIVQGKMPATIIYHDELIIVFDDILPKAPQHKLIVPRKHISTINDLTLDDKNLVNHMVYKAKDLAKELDIAESGYRLIFNCNPDGGQVVYHLHMHLIGGTPLHR